MDKSPSQPEDAVQQDTVSLRFEWLNNGGSLRDVCCWTVMSTWSLTRTEAAAVEPSSWRTGGTGGLRHRTQLKYREPMGEEQRKGRCRGQEREVRMGQDRLALQIRPAVHAASLLLVEAVQVHACSAVIGRPAACPQAGGDDAHRPP